MRRKIFALLLALSLCLTACGTAVPEPERLPEGESHTGVSPDAGRTGAGVGTGVANGTGVGTAVSARKVSGWPQKNAAARKTASRPARASLRTLRLTAAPAAPPEAAPEFRFSAYAHPFTVTAPQAGLFS